MEELITALIHDVDWPVFLITAAVVFWSYQFLRFCLWIIRLFSGDYKATSVSRDHLSVSKIEFSRQVVSWCAEHLGLPPKRKTLPQITLRYYRSNKMMGNYSQYFGEITVFWDSHSSILEIINTVIHEYQHFLDLRTGKDQQKYVRETEAVGYMDNVYEKRARQVAANWEKACYWDLKRKGVIRS